MTYRAHQWLAEQPLALVSIAAVIVAIGWLFLAPGIVEPQDRPWAVLTMVAVAVVLAMRLVVTVESKSVQVSLGGVLRRSIPYTDIASVRVASYRPLRTFGGWGWRFGRNGARMYAIRGNRAVVLTLHDGRLIFVGARDAEALAQAIGVAAGLPVEVLPESQEVRV